MLDDLSAAADEGAERVDRPVRGSPRRRLGGKVGKKNGKAKKKGDAAKLDIEVGKEDEANKGGTSSADRGGDHHSGDSGGLHDGYAAEGLLEEEGEAGGGEEKKKKGDEIENGL
ncbi:unnamed protein product, partial [Ascophyllum nodosum]